MENSMTIKSLLIATTVLTSIAFGAQANDKVLVGGPAYKAASQLVNQTSLARYALASNDANAAKAHIESAKIAGDTLAKLSSEERKVTGVRSGRVSYDIKTEDGAYFYYPVETGTVTTKEIGSGPFWSSNKGLAVKDAELVYMTVDINGADIQEDLTDALKDINDSDLADADDELNDILEEIVSIEDRQEALAIKAKDNLQLTRDYLAAKNYDAARYPLKHAKSALEDMDGNERYAADQAMVQKYLKEVERSEKIIAQKDPNAIEKLQKEWNTSWNDLKKWTDKKVN
jgi:hypothetical protein